MEYRKKYLEIAKRIDWQKNITKKHTQKKSEAGSNGLLGFDHRNILREIETIFNTVSYVKDLG